MAEVVRRLPLLREVWDSNSEPIKSPHKLPTTRHCCNLDVWSLVQSRDEHRALVTPERVLSEYNKDLIFLSNKL